ncbi:MAG: hypothetical protein KDC50_03745 [Flavobacterium sp.]|nr:hypothetical protein [Flavobacterium sp.]
MYDFKSKTIIDKNSVTHRVCDVFQDNPDKYKTAKFSNVSKSNCSMKANLRLKNSITVHGVLM